MSDEKEFKVTCPCCGALLTIDGKELLVVSHEAKAEPGNTTSFEDRLKGLEAEKRQSEERYLEAVRSEKSKKDVLNRKFEDLFEKAKQQPAGPITRDIDLD
ncbi:MAG: hypothetical protein P8Z49_09205 [Acidobacteriota bacterium]|jgi:hypothetical protein